MAVVRNRRRVGLLATQVARPTKKRDAGLAAVCKLLNLNMLPYDPQLDETPRKTCTTCYMVQFSRSGPLPPPSWFPLFGDCDGDRETGPQSANNGPTGVDHLTGWLYLNDETRRGQDVYSLWTPTVDDEAARRLGLEGQPKERRRLEPLDWQLRSRHRGHDARLTCPQTSNHGQHQAADASTGHNALALLEADAIRCSTERRNHRNRPTDAGVRGRAGHKQERQTTRGKWK